jgi:glycosyltransferase involved in cell wall biosynthesis
MRGSSMLLVERLEDVDNCSRDRDMTQDLLASIIVDNYNYRRFLKIAIDSALNQTYPNTEVIVVDDGSTDNSREIIARYGDRVIPVLKENGGQASAFNAGFLVSRGEVVCFLDADDALLPTAIERAVSVFVETDAVKVHWPLWLIDASGNNTGKVHCPDLPEGDLRESLMRHGPPKSLSPPTSGNAWARSFLKRVLPMPEEEFRINADCYLYTLAPAFGHIKRLFDPQSLYRIHGQNNYESKTFEQRVKIGVRDYDKQCLALCRFFKDRINVDDLQVWKANLWWHRIDLTLQEITRLIPAEDALILVDDDAWGIDGVIAGRRCIPFLERGGRYWGRPADDVSAIRELERLRRVGANFAVFAWPAFWWLEYYGELHRYLRSQFRCALENNRLVVFDLET